MSTSAAINYPWLEYIHRARSSLRVLAAIGVLSIAMVATASVVRIETCQPFAIGVSRIGSCDAIEAWSIRIVFGSWNAQLPVPTL
jgi:hypothetical protein